MNRLAWMMMGLAACGGGGGDNPDAPLVVDAPRDAPPDAPGTCPGPGALDPAYGSGGTARLSGTQGLLGVGIAPGPSGGALVAAQIDMNGNSDPCVVLRVTAQGALDPAFGTNGIARIAIPGFGCHLRAIAVQSDGKAIAVGDATSASVRARLLVRLTTAGAIDTTFGTGGAVVDQADPAAALTAVAIDSQDRIVTAGDRSVPSGFPGSFSGNTVLATVRYTRDGARDATFGTNGAAADPFPAGLNGSGGVAVLPGDKIVVGAALDEQVATNSFLTYLGVVRYTASGALDTTFATTGWTRVERPDIDNGRGAGLAVDGGGNIIVGAASLFARWQSDGTPDPAFTSPALTENATFLRRIALAPGGKLVATGQLSTAPQVSLFFTVRISATTGALDPVFGSGGEVETPPDLSGEALLVQADGSVLVAGFPGFPAASAVRLVRLCP